MKLKMSLDKKSIQEFFLQHTEKIIFGVVVALLLFMVYGAVVRPVFLSAPQDLRSLTDQARMNVLRTPGQVDLRVAPYDKIADNVRRHVDETQYALVTDFSPPVFPPRGKRGEPQTYPVEKLVVSTGFGAFSASGQAAVGGQGNRGYRWALVTGLVPIAQQTDAYYECFRNAFPREKNPPKYSDFEIERAEISDQAPDAALKWVKLDLDKADAITKEWSAPGQELVASKYMDEGKTLVSQLGPLVNRAWDASVGHPPEIPIGGNMEGGGAPSPDASVTPQPVAEDVHEGTGHHHHGARAAEKTVPTPKPEDASAKAEEIKYLLFRFFDFTVQPNKRYRYHVRLYLKNPNFGQETRWLQDSSLAGKELLTTRWSETTDVVAVPRDDRLLLVEIKPARGSMDASERFALLHWNADQGALVWNEKWAFRGQFMNFAKEEAKAVSTPAGPNPGAQNPLDNVPAAAPADDLLGISAPTTHAGTHGATKPGAKPTGPQADFLTELLLIDMRGGERQPGRDRAAKEPGEALFLDIDGSMVVHNEVADTAEWQRTTTIQPVERVIHHPKPAGKPGAVPGGVGAPPAPTPKPWAHPRHSPK